MCQWYRTYWACVRLWVWAPGHGKRLQTHTAASTTSVALSSILSFTEQCSTLWSIYTESVAHPSLNPRQHTTFQPPLRVLCASGVSPTPYTARPDLHSDLRVTLPCCGWFSHSGPSFMTSILGEAQKQYFYLPSLILCIFKVSTHDPALSKTDTTTTGCHFYHLPRDTRASLPTVQLVDHLVILLPQLHVMPSHKY